MTIGLLETKQRLENLLNSSGIFSISERDKEAIKRALREVEITIENGDESNL